MPSSEITYTTRNNETFTGYYTYPDGHGPFPGIVLITAIWGTDEEMKELADVWAADAMPTSPRRALASTPRAPIMAPRLANIWTKRRT